MRHSRCLPGSESSSAASSIDTPYCILTQTNSGGEVSCRRKKDSRCGASAGFKTFTVTFAEDFGVLCGREMRSLMTTAKQWKQEHLARFLFVPFRWVEQSLFIHWQSLKALFFCFMGKFKCIYNNIFFPSFDLLTQSNRINIRVWFSEILFSI